MASSSEKQQAHFPKLNTKSSSIESLERFPGNKSKEKDEMASFGLSEHPFISESLNKFLPLTGQGGYDRQRSLKLINRSASRKWVGQHSLRGQNCPSPLKPSLLRSSTRKEKGNSIYQVISKFYLVKKFIKALQASSLRKPRFLGASQFDLIGDSSFDFCSFKRMTRFERNSAFLQVLNWGSRLEIPKIHPFSKFAIIWNILHLGIFLAMFIIIPINICFSVDIIEHELGLSQRNKTFIRSSLIIFYIIDILVSLNLKFYENGGLISDKKHIAARYFHQDFLMEIISLLVLANWLPNSCSESKLIKFGVILYFLRFKRIRQIIGNFEEMLVTDENYFNIFSLLLLLLRIFIISHLSCCIWHLIGSLNDINSWLNSIGASGLCWHERYLYSFYFIVISMNTVGYGDITPQNPLEIYFCIIFVILGCLMFGYSLNCMGEIFHSFYKKERTLKEELFVINDFMKSKKISQSFQMKVRKYLQYVSTSERQPNLENTHKVFQKLSTSLKNELLYETYGSIVQKMAFFRNNFSEKTQRKVIGVMREENYPPGETIFHKGDHENHDLFFVKKGAVEIFGGREGGEGGRVLKICREGETFGELAFLTSQERSAGARSKEYTTVIRVDQVEFMRIVEENEADKEKLCFLRDMVRFSQGFDELGIRCYVCNQKSHLGRECPVINLKVIKEILIAKFNYSENQKRKKFQRKPFRRRIFHERQAFEPMAIKLKTLGAIHEWERDASDEELSSSELITMGDINRESDYNEGNSMVLNNQTGTEEGLLRRNLFNNKQPGFSGPESRQSMSFVNFMVSNEKILDWRKDKASLYSKYSSEEIKLRRDREMIFKDSPKNNGEEKKKVVESEEAFELIKIFTVYFPSSNAEEFIRRINKKTFQKLKKIGKSHLFFRTPLGDHERKSMLCSTLSRKLKRNSEYTSCFLESANVKPSKKSETIIPRSKRRSHSIFKRILGFFEGWLRKITNKSRRMDLKMYRSGCRLIQ